MSESALNRMN